MLPDKLRLWIFDRLSVKTMRYVSAVPKRQASGLVKRVYDMIDEDFFINGSLTSRSTVPSLLAAIWTSGRETMLVDDHLDRSSKEALCAVMSDVNDCPYCGDMLISLVDASAKHDAASAIFRRDLERIEDPVLRSQLEWIEAVSRPGTHDLPTCPYTAEQLPEVLGSMMAMADINRFSHVVMDGSPVSLPNSLQRTALRLFGRELKPTKKTPALPGRALDLLPPAELPADLAWAKSNPRIADALARWTAAVESETKGVVSDVVRRRVADELADWQNERMPLSRNWVERALSGLEGEDRALTRLALILAKAPYQVSEDLVEPLVGDDSARFVRKLAWASFIGARAFIGVVARGLDQATAVGTQRVATVVG
jgi:hypothetical protein